MSGLSSMLNNLLVKRKLTGRLAEFRSLQPICTALEVRSWKNALQLCAKLSRKQPNLYIVYALKTIALAGPRPVTQAAEQEILSSLEFVKAHANGAGLGDADVLLVFGWVLGVIGKGNETLAMLSKATELHPNTEDVLVEAFIHYVRVGERKSAQQISMRLSKIGQDDKYIWWSVVSILMQVRDPKNPANALLLSLAERQVYAHYASIATARGIDTNLVANDASAGEHQKGKSREVSSVGVASPAGSENQPATLEFDSAHDFHVVTRLLELRALQTSPNGDAGIAASTDITLPSVASSSASSLSPQQLLLAHLTSQQGDKWCESSLGLEIWRREIELRHGSLEGGEWKASWERLKGMLDKGDINWHSMLYLIRCAFAIADGSSAAYWGTDTHASPSVPREEGMQLIEQSRELFRRLADEGKIERGFLLALLEIRKESRQRQWETASIVPLIREYFERFSTKMCCFDDLLPHLETLDTEEAREVREEMLALPDSVNETSLKSIYRTINASKIGRYLSLESNEDLEKANAQVDFKRYFDALPIGKGLPSTDLQPADDFALLAAEALVAAGAASGNRAYFEQALVALEFGLQRSHHKYQLRILAVNICRLLGASSLALAHYAALKPRAIQNDTLSHLVLGRAATFALCSSGPGDVLADIVNAAAWYRTGEQEAAEMVVRVYSYANYTKIEDFSDFRDRLARSLNKHLVQIETMRVRALRGLLDPQCLAEATTQLTHMHERHKDALFDNRDFVTLPNLQPRDQPTIWDQTSMGPRPTTAWLQAFAAVYSRFLCPQLQATQPEKEARSQLTASEDKLLDFSVVAQSALQSGLEETEAEQAALRFFKDQTELLMQALDQANTLPWEILHIAQISLEGFTLLELAVERRTLELTTNKPADHAKLAKKVKAFRNAARDLLRLIGSKTIAHGKKVAKERQRTTTALATMKQFSQLDDDYIMNFSHALVESRKSAVETLGAAIQRATQK